MPAIATAAAAVIGYQDAVLAGVAQTDAYLAESEAILRDLEANRPGFAGSADAQRMERRIAAIRAIRDAETERAAALV